LPNEGDGCDSEGCHGEGTALAPGDPDDSQRPRQDADAQACSIEIPEARFEGEGRRISLRAKPMQKAGYNVKFCATCPSEPNFSVAIATYRVTGATLRTG